MAALGALALGLSIVFGGFVLVLLAELFYVFFWKRYGILRKRVRRIGTECNRGIGNLSHEAALVGSLGDYSTSSVEKEFVATLFPMGPEVIGSDIMFMDDVFPRFLYTIKEETEEDMEIEEPVNQDKESDTSFLPVQAFQSESPKQPSESPYPKKQQLMQRQFPHSIGVFQQPQILRSISKRSIAWAPTEIQQQIMFQGPSDLSLHSSCTLPSSPPHPSSSSFPSTPTSVSISPTLPSPKHQAFCSSGSSSPELYYVSQPVYDLDSNEVPCNTQPNVCPEENENENEPPCNIQYSGCSSPNETETPFDTPISSPSLLTPCGSPPMTPRLSPIKASKDHYEISINMVNHGSGTSYTFSSAESDPLSSSSKCSSPSSESWQESPTFHHPRGFSMYPTMVVPSYPNKSTWKPSLLERRAFASPFNRHFIRSLPLI